MNAEQNIYLSMNVAEMIAWVENHYTKFNADGPAFDPTRTRCYEAWRIVTLYDTKGKMIEQYEVA